MAKPIRATPSLNGEDALQFIKNMAKEEKRPSKVRVTTIKNARSRYQYFNKILSAV